MPRKKSKATIIKLEELLEKKEKYIKLAKEGKIFIYPTDSIYGIGKIYNGIEDIQLINRIKKRDEYKMSSIVVPNLERIIQKFPKTDINFLKKMLKIYGQTTFILDHEFPGMRFLQHPIQEFFSELNHPFITTSANIHGQLPITNISEIPKEILEQVDIIVDEGEKYGHPSTLIDLVEGNIIFR